MPVVVLATTEAARGGAARRPGSVAPGVDGAARRRRARFVAEPDEARAARRRGPRPRAGRYGLDRFLADWDRCLRR